ncbi:hypothetical protein [Curtobacterium sp. MCSS17_005]|nr:hypothetical protein [Curtobacterium sp. MCSS17_005]WIB33916.1 hypothetical protein DEJ20_05470 [Curtobacterium sp. MCSS17_005]
MNTNSERGTEYTGDDKERAKRPLTVQEQARAMRREGLASGNATPDKHPS